MQIGITARAAALLDQPRNCVLSRIVAYAGRASGRPGKRGALAEEIDSLEEGRRVEQEKTAAVIRGGAGDP